MVNQVLMYLLIFTPYLLEFELASLLILGFIGYLFLFEMAMLLICKLFVNVSLCNPYLWLQLFSGFLKKACILAFGILAGLTDGQDASTEWLDWLGFLAIIVD